MNDDFAAYWDGLHAQLASRLPPLTLWLFRDLPLRQDEAIADLVDGGKRLRAAVVVTVCGALGGDGEAALPSAAAIECVHAASLIHDDLIDGDHVRRDRAATWVVHGSRRAVLLADVIFATALQRSAEVGKREVVTLARAISTLAAGAYGEPLSVRDVATYDAAAQYQRTIRMKSGSLFSAAAELGAIAAGSKRALCRAAAEFGTRIGEAYQIADDLDDVVSCTQPLTSQQRATLASLLGCFDRSPARPRDARTAAERTDFDAERVARAMETEIERRLQLARDSFEPFVDGSQLALIRRIPRAIVHPAAPSAHPLAVVAADD